MDKSATHRICVASVQSRKGCRLSIVHWLFTMERVNIYIFKWLNCSHSGDRLRTSRGYHACVHGDGHKRPSIWAGRWYRIPGQLVESRLMAREAVRSTVCAARQVMVSVVDRVPRDQTGHRGPRTRYGYLRRNTQ